MFPVVRRVLLLLLQVCWARSFYFRGKMPWQHLGFHFTSGASQEEALPGPNALKLMPPGQKAPGGFNTSQGTRRSRGRGSLGLGRGWRALAGGGLCLSLSEGS